MLPAHIAFECGGPQLRTGGGRRDYPISARRLTPHVKAVDQDRASATVALQAALIGSSGRRRELGQAAE
jgi:hypothetical protein